MQDVYIEYQQLLAMQQFDATMLDYNALDKHFRFLQQLAEVENSAVSVFDMYQGKHVFASYNFTTLLGYDEDGLEGMQNEYFDARIHPEDHAKMIYNGVNALKFIYSVPREERKQYKIVTEFRVMNGEGNYIRVVEQQQALLLDHMHNVWLSLSVMDISPNQDGVPDVTGRIINFTNGKTFMLPAAERKNTAGADIKLTPRESQILTLVKEGLLSKEISDRLSISVHTVNTHRQRILEKLGADNSVEAIRYAANLGLVQHATTL